MRRLYYLLLSLCFILVSCEEKAPIPEDDMKDIMFDMFIIDNYVENNPDLRAQSDSMYVYPAVFEKYGYSADDYRTALEYYISNVETYLEMVNDVKTRLSSLADEVETDPQDSLDVDNTQKALEIKEMD